VIDLPIDRAVFDALVDMTGGDVAFVDELVDTYLDDGREQLAALQAAVATSDVTALVRPAHSLKTNSFNVGAMALGRLCQDLEQRARTGPLDDAAARVASIAASFNRVRDALLAERAARSAR
jgi:HPt (histidine-containing phosphotransfer) domain-containing protein